VTAQQDMEYLRNIFLRESQSLGTALASLIMEVDRSHGDKAALDQLFRTMHTLKAAAGAIPGARPISMVAHECENLLAQILESKKNWTGDMLPLFLEASDKIIEAIAQVSNGDAREDDVLAIIDRLQSHNSQTPQPFHVVSDIKPDALPPDERILVAPADMDGLKGGLSTLISVRNQLQSLIKVEEARSRPELPQLIGLGRSLGQAIDDISGRIAEVQRVPLAEVAVRVRRVVTEISRQLGKQIQLTVTGDDIKVDREVARSIGRAIEQVARNACDHGIETPERRVSEGKPPSGSVDLRFSVDKNGVTAVIADDGQGIDTAALRHRIKDIPDHKSQFDDASDIEILEAIFIDGMSTAVTVSDISGRGVGLPVAKSEVARLGGTVAVSSKRGRGTRFTLVLPHPRDESVSRVLIARSGLFNFAIPVERVVDISSLDVRGIAVANGRLTTQFRGKTIPVGSPAEWTGMKAKSPLELPFSQSGLVLVLSHDGAWHGVHIDNVLDQIDVTTQSLSPLIKKIPGINGVCQIPGNDIAFIMDPCEFIGIKIHE